MTGHFFKGFLLACAAICIACASEEGLGPIVNNTPTRPVPETVFSVLEISPVVDTVYPGFAIQLRVTPRSQSGDRLSVFPLVNYFSSAPEIAAVSATGLMTAFAPGAAIISATATIGGITRTGVMTMNVHPADTDPSLDLVLTSNSYGWQPPVAYMKAGGTVQWRASGTGWSGVPTTRIWLMNADYADIGSLNLSNASATMKLEKPGIIRYCSGGCWDPPDFGIIYVQ